MHIVNLMLLIWCKTEILLKNEFMKGVKVATLWKNTSVICNSFGLFYEKVVK